MVEMSEVWVGGNTVRVRYTTRDWYLSFKRECVRASWVALHGDFIFGGRRLGSSWENFEHSL